MKGPNRQAMLSDARARALKKQASNTAPLNLVASEFTLSLFSLLTLSHSCQSLPLNILRRQPPLGLRVARLMVSVEYWSGDCQILRSHQNCRHHHPGRPYQRHEWLRNQLPRMVQSGLTDRTAKVVVALWRRRRSSILLSARKQTQGETQGGGCWCCWAQPCTLAVSSACESKAQLCSKYLFR